MVIKLIAVIFNIFLYFQYNWSSIAGNSNWSIINWLVNNYNKLGLIVVTLIILVSMFKKTIEMERITKVVVLLSYLLMLGVNILEFNHGIDKLEAGVIALNKVLTLEKKQNLVISYVQLIMIKNYEMFKDTTFNDYYLKAWKEILLCTKEYINTTSFITLTNSIKGKYELMDISLKLVGNSMEIYNFKQSLSIDELIRTMKGVESNIKTTTATLLGFITLTVALFFYEGSTNPGIIDWFTSLLNSILNYLD